METRTTTLRWALLAAAGLVLVGLFWDSAYHARNPGPEAGIEMLESHGVMWAGSSRRSASPRSRSPAGRSGGGPFSFALGGALAGVLGHALDVYAHGTERSAALAHLLFTAGELVLVAAVVVSPRSLRLPGFASAARPTASARSRRSNRSRRRR